MKFDSHLGSTAAVVPVKFQSDAIIYQLGAAANFGDRTYRQIWGPNVNNNIYILIPEYSSTGFE